MLLDLVSISSIGNRSETIGTKLAVTYSHEPAERGSCFRYCLETCLLGTSHFPLSLYRHNASVEKTLLMSEESCPCELNAFECQCSVLPVVSWHQHCLQWQSVPAVLFSGAHTKSLPSFLCWLCPQGQLSCLVLFSCRPGYSTSRTLSRLLSSLERLLLTTDVFCVP